MKYEELLTVINKVKKKSGEKNKRGKELKKKGVLYCAVLYCVPLHCIVGAGVQ